MYVSLEFVDVYFSNLIILMNLFCVVFRVDDLFVVIGKIIDFEFGEEDIMFYISRVYFV